MLKMSRHIYPANKVAVIILPFWIHVEADDTRILWTHVSSTTTTGISMLICGWYDPCCCLTGYSQS